MVSTRPGTSAGRPRLSNSRTLSWMSSRPRPPSEIVTKSPRVRGVTSLYFPCLSCLSVAAFPIKSICPVAKACVMQRTRYPERRRTVRLPLQIPVRVRCRLPEGETIDLQAATYVVSAHGALLLMDTPLLPGQNIRIFNEMTAESAECHVTSLREKRERRFVGITFSSPNTDFWHIVFPKAGTRQAVRSPQTGALVPPGFRQDDNNNQF